MREHEGGNREEEVLEFGEKYDKEHGVATVEDVVEGLVVHKSVESGRYLGYIRDI